MGITQRTGSPFWWYSFTVNGRRFRGSTGATGKQAARAVEAVARAEAQIATPQPGHWRISTLTGTYLQSHGQHLASKATVVYQLAALNTGLGAASFIADITGEKIIAYRARRRGDGLGPASVNRELQLLRAALKFAERHFNQPVPRIDWRGLFLKEPPGRTHFLSPADFATLSAACDDELRTIVLIAVSTGLRRDNIEGLTWERVNLDQAVAHVIVKGNKSHTVKLNQAVIAALGRTAPHARQGALFTQPNRRKRWEAAKAASGLPPFRFHDLRHTFASWARLAGADIADIKEALDHSDIAMTMRYAHITPATHRTAFDAVADLFQPKLAQKKSRKIATD